MTTQETASRARELLSVVDADHAGDDDERIAVYLLHGDIEHDACLRLVQLRRAVRDLLAENVRLQDALRTYGHHHANCAVTEQTWQGRKIPCDCGLMAALAGEETQTGR